MSEPDLEALAKRERTAADSDATLGDVALAARRLRDLKGYLKLRDELTGEDADDGDTVPDRQALRARLEQEFASLIACGEPEEAERAAGD